MTISADSQPPGAQLVIPIGLTAGPQRRRQLLKAGLVVAIVAACVIAWALFARPTAIVYRTEPVSRRTILHSVEAMGHLDVPERFEVPASGPGWLARILVVPGQRVHRGQLLAQLDPTSALLAVASARDSARVGDSRTAEARVALDSTRDVRVRTERLAARGLASQADLQAARAAEDRAKAALASAQAERAIAVRAVSSASAQRRMTAVLAPADGIVLVAPDRVGATVSPEGGRLFVLGSTTDTMHLVVSVAEADLADVQAGQPAHFTVPAFPGRIFEARVLRVDPEAQRERNSVTYAVTLIVDNHSHLLFPGMTASAGIDVAVVQQALAVREAAFRFVPPSVPAAGGDRRSGVWRLGTHGRLESVAVEPGLSDGAYAEVRGPGADRLKVGEPIVIGLVSPDQRKTPGPGVALGRR